MRKKMQRLCAVLAMAAAMAVSGCSGGGGEAAPVSFAAAQAATTAVTVEGIPNTTSLRKESGKPTEFTIREESSAKEMRVCASPEVTVPANFTSASYVVVTGTYDPTQRVFVATQVETKVPTREQQPRG
ncbi:MAG: cytochrome c maturation protein CcmE [Actinomycetota bacterium]